MTNERYSSVEAQTTRLYFRNYVNNILTAVTPLTVQIRSRGSATVLASPTIVTESVGVYYVDWAIPSSDVASLRYNPTFPGTGDYQDVWYTGATVLLAQDFFVYPENFPNNLTKISEPIKLIHTLETNRFEEGAKDYLTWRIAETSSKLVTGQSVFPEGQLQLFFGDQLIRNYDYSPLIHKTDSDQYKYFVDTTSLKKGIYKVQCRFFVPQETVHTKANLTSLKSLLNGYFPNTDSNLGLTIDGENRVIPFYRTSTNATIQGHINSLTFNNIGNDILKFNIDGTDKTIRLLNTGSVKPLAELVAELNGTVPALFTTVTGPNPYIFSFPIVTSNLTLGATVSSVSGKTLVFKVDSIPYTVQFTGADPLATSSIVSQINVSWQVTNPGSSICHSYGGVLTFGQNNSGAATMLLEEVEIVSGTALSLLGFVANQKDTDTPTNLHSIAPLVASGVTELVITNPSTTGDLTLYSAALGSSANNYLGLSSQTTIADAVLATGAKISGLGATFPISVTNPSSGSVTGTAQLPSSWAYPNTLGGQTVILKVNGGAPQTVTFVDNQTPTAITSIFAFGTYNVHATTLIIKRTAPSIITSTTTFSGTNPMTVQKVIAQVNAKLATDGITNIVMDLYNGHLRLRATTTGVTFDVLVGSTGDDELGLDSNVVGSPEALYQNDQVQSDGSGGVRSHQTGKTSYIKSFTPSDVVSQINSQTIGCTASLVGNKIVIASDTTGIASSIEITGGTAVDDLYLNGLTSPTVWLGTEATNNSFNVVTAGPVTQAVTLTTGTKSLAQLISEINAQTTGVIASQGGVTADQLVFTTSATGTAATLSLTDVTSGTVVALIGTGTNPATGVAASLGTITGDTYIPTKTISGGNARLIISDDVITTPTIIDLSACTTVANVVTAINASFAGRASEPTAGMLLIASPTFGANSYITIGGQNDGSDANPLLGMSQNGLTSVGTNGQPYTLQQIIGKINAAFGGFEVASTDENFITLTTIAEGAGSYVEITSLTSADILNIWGLSVGTYVGESKTQTSQTIVSPKLTLFLGD